MLSSRAKIHRNVARLPHLHQQCRHRSALPLTVNSRAGYATSEAALEESDSIKHLIKGPVTPLTIFATSPPPPPHPSTYMVPASVADGAALDFRLSFALSQVQKIKRERFQEEMGVFKILYERPFLQEYKNVMTEKHQQNKNERIAARKARQQKKKLGLVPPRKRSLFQLEQDRQRKQYLQSLRYPIQLADSTVKGDELKRYFNFIGTHTEKDIYDRLYPEFFGDTRECVEALVPHKHDGYVWNTFFDPENPDDFPNQAEAEGDIWESLNLSAEQQLSDLADEMEGEQEKEARLANWELDPARFKGKWTPRAWPKEDLELSHIKQRARNLRYLREQLIKHDLLPADESATRESLQKLEGASGETSVASLDAVELDQLASLAADDDETKSDDVYLLFDDEAGGDKAKASAPVGEDSIASLLDSVLPQKPAAVKEAEPEPESQESEPKAQEKTSAEVDKKQEQRKEGKAEAEEETEEEARRKAEEWRAKVDVFQAGIRKRTRAGATDEELLEDLTRFLTDEGVISAPGGASNTAEGGESEGGGRSAGAEVADMERRLSSVVDVNAYVAGGSSAERALINAGAMKKAREREARLHRLQEHTKVPFDDSQKKKIFANEPIPGEPTIEFIHSYSMDPDVVMGSLGRREFLQRKVVMKVHVPSLGLPPAVQQRLADLTGSRFDAGSGWLKLVGDKHPNRHLNQKYLKLLMRELLNESYLAYPGYSPLSDLSIQDPSSLRRKYALPSHLQALLDGNSTAGEWEYKMFKFGSNIPAPQEVAERTTRLRQQLASAFSS